MKKIIMILQFVSVLIAFYCSNFVLYFFIAITPEEAVRKGYPDLPTDWSAGVMNHGEYIKWWTIQERPLFFWSSLVGLIISILVAFPLLYRCALYLIRRRIKGISFLK
ncbi:MAG: hypothetical protein ACIAQZ_05660 [Sedimentisphaeraceae bacterium JB056]